MMEQQQKETDPSFKNPLHTFLILHSNTATNQVIFLIENVE